MTQLAIESIAKEIAMLPPTDFQAELYKYTGDDFINILVEVWRITNGKNKK